MAKKKQNNQMNLKQLISLIISVLLLFGINYINEKFFKQENEPTANNIIAQNYDKLEDIPEFTNQAYVEINNNVPFFEEKDYVTVPFEKYSNLDEYGRCGIVFANVCKEIMPKDGETRGDISRVKPTGWIQKKYNNEFLYNRCHLIGYQLSAENDNECNLITGTRYFNVEGMLPFENEVANYVKNSKENVHVLYRVTPVFKGNNLLASGLEIEAYSVEDKGEGVCFNVYIYNVQPGIIIDYKTGESSKDV